MHDHLDRVRVRVGVGVGVGVGVRIRVRIRARARARARVRVRVRASERVPRSLVAIVRTAASAQRDQGDTPSADGRMMMSTPTKPISESSQPASPIGSPG